MAIDVTEAQPGLRLTSVAQVAGVSTGHLARAFRAQFGCSVGAFARGRRLERAAALLRGGKLPLAEVAAAVGFYDQPHFTRAFKEKFGVTPRVFRKG